MEHPVTAGQAQAALDAVQRGRSRVVEQIGLPTWYWWGLAAGWVLLGALADAGHPVVSAVVTLAFGTAHAAVAPRVLSGRRRTRQVTVRAELTGPQGQWLVVAGLVALTVLTVVLALALDADGARHPVTAASVLGAVVLLLGGRQLGELARRTAA
jgi:hypothetical protein